MKKNLYSRAKISVRALEIFILLGLMALVVTIVYLSANGGFDIKFDTRGGSDVETQRLRYGQKITEPPAPTREGYVFLGWYADEGLTKTVDLSSMSATESITLYASWEEE